MESFIVRVYRRGRSTPEEIAGLVESVETDERAAFQSFSGLVKSLREVILHRNGTSVDKCSEQSGEDRYSPKGEHHAG